MKNTVLGLLLAVLVSVAQAGDVLSLKAGHPQTYVVKRGDTLWDISAMFLDDPWLCSDSLPERRTLRSW